MNRNVIIHTVNTEYIKPMEVYTCILVLIDSERSKKAIEFSMTCTFCVCIQFLE